MFALYLFQPHEKTKSTVTDKLTRWNTAVGENVLQNEVKYQNTLFKILVDSLSQKLYISLKMSPEKLRKLM